MGNISWNGPESMPWREHPLRKYIFEKMPELVAGLDLEMYSFDVSGWDGDTSKIHFQITDFRDRCTTPPDFSSLRFNIAPAKGRYELVYDLNHYVIADSYEELVEKRNLLLDGKIEFIRVPEFEGWCFIDEARVATAYCGCAPMWSGASSPYVSIEDCARFLSRNIPEKYQFYAVHYSPAAGYIYREKWIEPERLKKELAAAARRKKTRAAKQLNERSWVGMDWKNSHIAIHIEETLGDLFRIEIQKPRCEQVLIVPITVTEEELYPQMFNLLSENVQS